MATLTSFNPAAKAVIIGSSGGIGSAFESTLRDDPAIGTVAAYARSTGDQPIDITDDTSVEAAAADAGDELDLVVVTTGILHGEAVSPEKSMRELDAATMQHVLSINTVGPALVAKHFLPRMRRKGKSVFAVLSARVGSIGDNRLGGWTSYRASKAALNMVIRTLAVEQARRFPESVLAALHPGTVATNLSAPFQRNVPEGKLFSTDRAARQLLSVIDGLGQHDNGGFFAWDGQAIQF